LSEEVRPTIDALVVDRAQYLVAELKKLAPYIEELDGITKGRREAAIRALNEYALSVKMAKVNPQYMEAFFKKPYPRLRQVPGKPGVWELALPRFIDVQIGWLESMDDGWNYFRVSRQMDWLGEIPDTLKKQMGWTPPPELILEGEELVGSREAVEEAKKKYQGMVSETPEGTLRVNPRRAFDLLQALIRDGVRPWLRKPIDKRDLVDGRKFGYELRDYQEDAWKRFSEFSSMTLLFPPGIGKTVEGAYAMTRLRPPHLVTMRTRLLVEQWRDRIESHTDLKLDDEVYVMTYQTAVRKSAEILKRLGVPQFTLKIVDEVQHWPSDWFSKMAFIPSKYTIGLTATPWREDGREELIYALAGPPVGMAWDKFKEAGIIAAPTSHVWVVKDQNAKLRQLSALVDPSLATIIFCDYIEPGKMLAARFKTDYFYGTGKENLASIREALASKKLAVVSRIGDEGLSLPEIQRVVEYNWNYGSRMQSMQRFGRLLHSEEAKVDHHIVMTFEEYLHDRKRLYSIMEKGFKIVLHHEGIGERTIQQAEAGETKVSRMPRPYAQAPKGERVAAPPRVEVPPIPAAVTQRLPGIDRTLERLASVEKVVAQTILGNPQRTYTMKELTLATGYSMSVMTHAAHLPKLIEMGLVKKAGKTYGSAL
jgi:DNA excision repair protein ERCC-3